MHYNKGNPSKLALYCSIPPQMGIFCDPCLRQLFCPGPGFIWTLRSQKDWTLPHLFTHLFDQLERRSNVTCMIYGSRFVKFVYWVDKFGQMLALVNHKKPW